MKFPSVSVASALQLLACSSASAPTGSPQTSSVSPADKMTSPAPADTILVTGSRVRKIVDELMAIVWRKRILIRPETGLELGSI